MLYRWNCPPDDAGVFCKEVLGGKGHGLFEMAAAGVPVPEFVVIPTQLCVEYMANPAHTKLKIKGLVKEIIEIFGEGLASGHLPFLSVRSGARVSMPGMMDTILNVGAGTQSCSLYAGKMSPRQFVDCSRRFLHMYGSTVLGLSDKLFENEMHKARTKAGVETDAELTADQLDEVVGWFKAIYANNGKEIPTTLADQLFDCIIAVMESWNSERAIEYREHNSIPHDWGTAVVVQRMVFGNMNEDSGSGVLFSRNPITGFNSMTGEFLPNAQGEDVVAGIRTPLNLDEMKALWPETFEELLEIVMQLESQYRDMLDIEFTVEDGKLYLLQVRVAKRSARAWVRSTLDFYNMGEIDLDTVLTRIKRAHVRLLTQPVVDDSFETPPHLTGLPACSGVVTGLAAFTKEQALAYKAEGKACILIRHETSPEDIAGMFAAVGILTATGGATSHAAVVARGMDKVCVTGAGALQCNDHKASVNGEFINPGAKVTICGTTGRVWFDTDVPVSDPASDSDLADLIAFVESDQPQTVDLAMPGSPGTVYSLAQFLGEVPPPTAKAIEVIVSDDLADPLIQMTGEVDLIALLKRLRNWAETHNVTATVYTDKGDMEAGPIKFVQVGTGLDALLTRPTTIAEVESFFGGSLAAVAKLVAPAKLADKFKLTGCSRYRLLAAFN